MVHRLPVFVMVELQRPLIPFMHQTIAAVRRLLWDIGQQFDRRGQRLAAEADVGDRAPASTSAADGEYAAASAAGWPAHAASRLRTLKPIARALQQAILFETIPRGGRRSLLFQRPIVKVDFTRQQDVEVSKGWRCYAADAVPAGYQWKHQAHPSSSDGKIGVRDSSGLQL